MRLHPLHTVEQITHHMSATGEYFPVERCTGRTTAQALRMVAYCLNNPHVTIRPKDHHGTTPANEMLVDRCRYVVESLGLRGFGFTKVFMWFGTQSPMVKDMS